MGYKSWVVDYECLKNIIVKRIFYLAVLLLACGSASAQDVHFSQFFENAALRNPALTGVFSGDYKVSANYRTQWGTFVVPFQTALVSAETKALLREETGDYLSFGLTAVYDKAGSLDFTGTSVYGAVNYNKALGSEAKTYLSVGLCAGYMQRSFDVSKVRTASQFTGGDYNASASTGESASFGTLRHWDASAGISLSGTLNPKVNYYIGGAGYHISKPQESFYDATFIRLTTRWCGNAGVNGQLGHGFGLTVHANYQYQYPYQETMIGGLFSHGFRGLQDGRKIIFSTGCFYRFEDAVIPMMQMEYDNWALTASYDITLASKRLYLSGFGGYELSLSLRGKYNRKQSGEIKCPRFEHDLDFED